MTFTPHGKHLIAGDWVGGAATFRSEPAHGPAHDFAVGTVDLVNRACEAAEDAFWSYGYSTREQRAAFLDAIADKPEPAARDIGRLHMRMAVQRTLGAAVKAKRDHHQLGRLRQDLTLDPGIGTGNRIDGQGHGGSPWLVVL